MIPFLLPIQSLLLLSLFSDSDRSIPGTLQYVVLGVPGLYYKSVYVARDSCLCYQCDYHRIKGRLHSWFYTANHFLFSAYL